MVENKMADLFEFDSIFWSWQFLLFYIVTDKNAFEFINTINFTTRSYFSCQEKVSEYFFLS